MSWEQPIVYDLYKGWRSEGQWFGALEGWLEYNIGASSFIQLEEAKSSAEKRLARKL